MTTVFRNVNVVTPDAIEPSDIVVDAGGRITDLIPQGAPVNDSQAIDGGGHYAFPGMLDLLQHGFGHHQYTAVEPDGIANNSRRLPEFGVTAFAPSILSLSEEVLLCTLAGLAANIQSPGARVLGLHSEGPCLAAPGAHRPDSILTPSARLADKMLTAADGHLAFVTLAPERPGAADFCRTLRQANVGLHLGHALATPDDVPALPAMGISGVTHMFDVMFPAEITEGGRYPLSLVDALLAEPALCLGLICDGVHVLPTHVRLLAQLPVDRIFLETDSMKFAGLPAGRFELYPGSWVHTSDDDAARSDHGGLAGSCITSDHALRNLIAYTGMDLARASHATSLNPARLAGRERDLGSIEVGKFADIVLLNADLHVQATYIAGCLAYTI